MNPSKLSHQQLLRMDSAMKFKFLSFDGKNNFNLLSSIVQDLLVKQGLDAALDET